RFWERTVPHADAQTQRRFIATFGDCVESAAQQAIDRNERRIRDIQSYINMRRDNSAIKPSLVLIEIGLDIPEEVLSHPAIEVIYTATSDMVWIDNDMTSFNIEQARGHDHNLVISVMHELDTDINGAMLWIADLHKETEMKFLEAMAALPTWGEPIDSQVRKYCDGLASWVRGNVEWSFESERFFGNKGAEVKRKRWNTLIPKDSLKGRVIGSVVD
ncbi:terpenoid synthase, partial [Rhizopogon salebrosus TDB-379]